MKKNYALWGSVVFITLSFALPGLFERMAAGSPILTTDCIKCHKKLISSFVEKGGKHKEFNCADCHEGGHPPKEEITTPDCSDCHSGNTHFESRGCLDCHSNPHAPKELHFADDITEPCLSCHPEPGEDFRLDPSKHSDVPCSTCHAEHGKIPECFGCHEKHTKEQTLDDCLYCHPPHYPLDIEYKFTTPSSFCTPCHAGIGEALKKAKTRHGRYACAFCHREIHRVIPRCRVCHGEPHIPELHAETPDCLDCHNDAHDLIPSPR